jgi:hypothetical protein
MLPSGDDVHGPATQTSLRGKKSKSVSKMEKPAIA